MHGNLEPEENAFFDATPSDLRTTVTGEFVSPRTWKDKVKDLAKEAGGTFEEYNTLNSVGKSSKKIVIEYDIEQNSGGS